MSYTNSNDLQDAIYQFVMITRYYSSIVMPFTHVTVISTDGKVKIWQISYFIIRILSHSFTDDLTI